MKNKKRFATLLLVLAMVFSGCAGNPTVQPDVEQEVEKSEEQIREDKTEQSKGQKDEVDKSIYMDPTKSVEERVSALLTQMTLEEKVAQMIQPEQAAISVKDITKYGFGSVLSGGGSAPKSGNTAQDWQKHINHMKQAALETRLGIPLIYGVDAVHGHGNVYGATVFPHNIGLGAAKDEELIIQMGQIVAKETRATGIQWIFAPTLANPQNELWGRTYEGFSEDANLVAKLGAAFTTGAQGDFGETSVVTTAKHYLGEGYTVAGTNQGDVQMEEEEFETLLREVLLTPYRANVEAGVRTVMASFNSVNGLKCHENTYLLTDVLKGDLGFTGFVIGDYNGAQQVSGANYKEQLANCVNAGVDMLMEPYSWKDVHRLLQQAVKEGLISQERIDDAVSRILRVKFEAGLFEEVVGGEMENSLLADFGCDAHRQVAREAVRKSMVLLKNDVLQDETGNAQTAMQVLQNSKKLLVVGAKANDIGVQCGGWTISWQGSAGNITEGTTILEALKKADEDREVIFNTDGTINGDEDAVLVVVGENPYAETSGDRSFSTLTVSGEDKALLKDMEEAVAEAGTKGVPVILLLLSGRPVTIADYVDRFDAIVAAWLPGSEGDGVADVLLGSYDFTGTLPYTWPWYASDIETKLEEGKEGDILFKFGTGLMKNGDSLTEEGTKVIGTKPEKAEEELEALKAGNIDLESTEYVLKAENYNANSWLVQTGTENNITFVENWGTEWANAKWDVWIPKEGKYTLHFYIAAAKDSKSVSIYYASPTITDDGNANRTVVPMTKTADRMTYEDFTQDVYLDKGSYEFKFMTDRKNGADFRLDRIWFEYQD